MKFNFPNLTPLDEKIIKEYCKILGYRSVIDHKNKVAKIIAHNKSMYVVKTTDEYGLSILGVAKTKIDKSGNLIYLKFENIYVKYKESLEGLKYFGKDHKGDFMGLFKMIYGLSYYFDEEMALFKTQKSHA